MSNQQRTGDSSIPDPPVGLHHGMRNRRRLVLFGWTPHPLTLIVTAIVAWGIFDVQTDHYPFMQPWRPDYYVYGWPICFSTSGRGRFNFFQGFKTGFFFLDLAISVLLLAATAFAVESLARRWPRVGMVEFLAVATGVGLAIFVMRDVLNAPLQWLFGVEPPRPTIAAVPGNLRPISRLTVPIPQLLSFGFGAVGFAFAKLLLDPPAVRRSEGVGDEGKAHAR